MLENELTESEVDKEIQRMMADLEKKKVWMACEMKGQKVFIPDTGNALGHNVFDTGRFECEAPDPDLIVRAWPLKYAGNFRLEDEFTREMRYGDADRSSMSFFPGVIKDGKVV